MLGEGGDPLADPIGDLHSLPTVRLRQKDNELVAAGAQRDIFGLAAVLAISAVLPSDAAKVLRPIDQRSVGADYCAATRTIRSPDPLLVVR